MTQEKNTPYLEIMAPAGSYAAMQAAIASGADSIYFGIEQLNMRARAASNFTIEEMPKIATMCAEKGVKTYLTLNTVLYSHDIPLMKHIADSAKAAGITAVIASDVAAISYLRSIDMEVHISTQANVSNIEAVAFYAQYADVIVLARELTIQQVKYIHEQIIARDIRGPKGELVQIELFVHGALCVAISGKCYMSLATHNASANRGACVQNCRRSYRVIDEETGEELKIENKHVMSPKDLATIGMIDQIVDAGVNVFKIEGRGRSAEYVSTVVKAYKEAVTSYMEGTYTQDKVAEWTRQLRSVYNRDFWHGGYYLGKTGAEWAGQAGSQATEEKHFIGKTTHYYPKTNIVECKLEAGTLSTGDEVYFIGPTTGSYRTTIQSLRIDDTEVETAEKGSTVTFPVETRLRESDKLFVIKTR